MKAQPAPMVSGRYFLPKAPLLCLKRMPAWVVTSVNSIGPVGRGVVGVGVGDGDSVAAVSPGWVSWASGACLQAETRRRPQRIKRILNVCMKRELIGSK